MRQRLCFVLIKEGTNNLVWPPSATLFVEFDR